MPRRLLSLVVAYAVLAGFAGRATAQLSPLESAEASYLEIDFEGTRDHAMEALRAGGNTADQMVRIYQLLGIASSALGDSDAARDYFARMLGIDPDALLDDSVPPRLREPYLEARGAWAARSARLEVEVGLDRGASALRFQLRDPTDMARSLHVGGRLEGASAFVERTVPAERETSLAVEGARDADRVEYFVDVRDAHDNSILSEGSEYLPEVIGRGVAGSEPVGESFDLFTDPVFWAVVGGVVAAAIGVTVGVAVDQQSRIGVRTVVTSGLD